MKNERGERSSDLDRARASSQRLRGEGGAEPPGPSPYVAFRSRPAAGAAPPAPASPAIPPPPALGAGQGTEFGPRTWERMLTWCCAAARAEIAFLLDAHGLVVASRGPGSSAEVEGMGARLLAAIEQVRRLAPPGAAAPAVNVEMGARWLTGFALALPDGTGVMLGLVGPKPAGTEIRTALQKALGAGQTARQAAR